MLRNWLKQNLNRYMFDNRLFWNDRYKGNPEKGSGPGSRGSFLSLKNGLIRTTMAEHNLTSILDIGCGDLAILESLEIPGYVGIDISRVIVERNRASHPSWKFICADLAGSFQPPSAELVLCLDVLIHQRSHKDFNAIISKAVAAAEKVLLISGYAAPFRGSNVFFHEPILDSVQSLYKHGQITKIAEYQCSDLLKLVK